MKKYLAMTMLLAGVSATAAAASVAVTVPTSTVTQVGTGTAGQFTLSGDAGAAAGAKWFADATAQGGSYVKVAFTVTGGGNVLSAVRNDASVFIATATSTKDNQVFGGNTSAGAVKLIGACAATTCAVGDVTDTADGKGIGAASSM